LRFYTPKSQNNFSKAIKVARQEYVNTTALLHMVCPSIEEGLSFEEAAEKSGKRFDKKLSETEKAAFYRLSFLVSKVNSADEKSDDSEKIQDLEATVASKTKKIKELEAKLKKVIITDAFTRNTFFRQLLIKRRKC
jgi:hypothetical protein